MELADQFHATLQEIFLMIVFRLCKGAQRQYRAMDAPAQFRFHCCFGFECKLFLSFVVIKDGVHVLSIQAAAGRPVARPEDIQQIDVGNSPRIVIDLNDFGMIADTVVIRIGCLTAGIPYAGSDHTVDEPELGLYSPESTESECGRVELCGDLSIDKRHNRLQLHCC